MPLCGGSGTGESNVKVKDAKGIHLASNASKYIASESAARTVARW